MISPPRSPHANWSLSIPDLGVISNAGLFTPNGNQTGKVTVTCEANGAKASTTLSVFIHSLDNQGGLIQNTAERYAFSSDSVMREPDGRAIITLARDARPGNWLPIGGSRVNLVLTVQDAAWAAAVYEGGAKPLPAIQRLACR